MLDGDPTTRFIGRFDDQVGQAWRIRSGTPFAVDEIELDVVVGPRQSVPTELVVTVDDVEAGRFPTGLSASDTERVGDDRAPVNAESATTVRIEVAASTDTLTRDWYSNAFISMPFAIAEMRVGGLGVAAAGPVDTDVSTVSFVSTASVFRSGSAVTLRRPPRRSSGAHRMRDRARVSGRCSHRHDRQQPSVEDRSAGAAQ